MDWLPVLLSTTSKVLVLLNGKSINISCGQLLYRVCIFVQLIYSIRQINLSECPILEMCRRTVVSIPCGPSALAVKEAAWGLARYAAISQVCSPLDSYVHH